MHLVDLVPSTDASPVFFGRRSEVKWDLPSHDMNHHFAMQKRSIESDIVRWHIKHGDFFHFANCLTVIAMTGASAPSFFLSYWPNMAAIANAPFGTRGAGVWNLHSFDAGWTTKTTYHILNPKLVSYLLTSWNLQNCPRILFLRLFPTSGCP